MQSDPLQELISDTLFLLQEIKDPYLLSDQAEYDFFRSWALSHASPKAKQIVKTSIPSPEIKAPRETPPLPKNEEKDPFKQLFARIAPQISVTDHVPSDLEAQKLAARWKTKSQVCPIPLLSFHEPPELSRFFEEISKAISIYFLPSRLILADPIEQEKQWEAFFSSPELAIILVSDITLRRLPHLLRYYKEAPTSNTRTLGKYPLILLPDLSLCLKDPKSKRSLWNLLCKKIEPILLKS